MADKISTVVLKVDLECERCYKKIRKVLCKIQDKMNIKTISFDEKSSAVLLSGPFDADKLCRKLCSEAGRVIREMHVQGEKASRDKDGGGGGDKPKAGKPAEKDSGKVEKADKKDAGAGKPEKADKKDAGGGKPEKADKKDAGGGKPEKAEKKVKFDFDDAPAGEPKPMKPMPQLPPGMSKADLGPLLEKMMRAKQGGPEPPRGEPMGPPPMMPAPAPAQGVAVPSIWTAPAGPVSGYSYNPAAYGGQPPAYYGGGGGCGGGCQCGSCCKAGGGYYGGGAPAYDHQGWYYGGNRQQPCYYQPQQPYHCSEDPNAGCSVM